MTTPLGIGRNLRLAFPEFIEVRLVREGPYSLRAYCVLADPSRPAPADQVTKWIATNKAAHGALTVEQVTTLPSDLDDEERLLRRTRVPRVVAEGSNTSGPGLVQALRSLYPNEVVDVVGADGVVTLHVDPDVAETRDEELLCATRLLMSDDPVAMRISRDAPPSGRRSRTRGAESQSTYDALAADTALLHDALPDSFRSELPPLPGLPTGASTYGSPHDGVDSLLQRLALFDNVYLYVPFSEQDFPKWAGTTFADFLDALPTGRIIPVFGQALERYDPGLTSRILDAGPQRVILQGEHTLRTLCALRRAHPLLAAVETELGRQVRGSLASSEDERRFLAYLDALAEIVERTPSVAITGQALDTAIFPLAQWVDSIRAEAGWPERSLEVTAAIEHRAATDAVDGVPMSRVGHYLDGGLRFVYGAEETTTGVLRIPDPTFIGKICFPDSDGITPREFAETFRGPRVEAMRELMRSTRVQTANDNVDLVRQFNSELKRYARRADAGYVAVATVLTVVGAFAAGVPTALAALSLELARRVGSRKAPGAFATATSIMTGTTREAALLARIQKEIE